MKKMIATLMALMMVFAFAACAVAEESTKPTFTAGVQFDMDMEQVMELVNLPNPEIEGPKLRGKTEFYELEYEHIKDDLGYAADITYYFVGNGLTAIQFDMADGTDYEKVKADLTGGYGEAVPFDAAKIGNAKYLIDDDGDLKDCKEMIEAEGVTNVLEQEKDGDVDVIMLDPTADYITV